MPVALQNHSGLTSTGDDMLRFHREVNHPNFTYHSIEQVAPLTQFVRAKIYDIHENGREKWIDYDRVFEILRNVHYNGFISMIYEGREDKTTVIPKGIRLLRSFVVS